MHSVLHEPRSNTQRQCFHLISVISYHVNQGNGSFSFTRSINHATNMSLGKMTDEESTSSSQVTDAQSSRS
ncbi:hypothetical protein LRAMOSA10029 [Lichtheimia ramosa]|uniref:Uncharacterized protein n=1 Tax=Lichtheimia ramosa TaxID=688394 RepID=A0A077WNH9_9FUNG|nr:hypothetical protein LRAMOSA10029 [Lichtheimia ramosa]